MGVFQKQNSNVSVLLAIYTMFSPSMIESETWGLGEVMVLDAVIERSITSSSFWAFESMEYHTLGGPPNSSQFLFPYSAPMPVIIVWFIGCLSMGIVILVLNGKISPDLGFLILIIATLLPFFLPGINSYSVEYAYTYRRMALPIPQIIGIIIIVFTRK
jgi:hypothetical protein